MRPILICLCTLAVILSAALYKPAHAGPLRNRKTSFRQAFLQAAKDARDAGEISRAQHLRLRLASWNPRKLAAIEERVTESAIVAGVMPAAGPDARADWSSIIAFIREVMPLILQFIDLFSEATPDTAAAIAPGELRPPALACGLFRGRVLRALRRRPLLRTLRARPDWIIPTPPARSCPAGSCAIA